MDSSQNRNQITLSIGWAVSFPKNKPFKNRIQQTAAGCALELIIKFKWIKHENNQVYRKSNYCDVKTT